MRRPVRCLLTTVVFTIVGWARIGTAEDLTRVEALGLQNRCDGGETSACTTLGDRYRAEGDLTIATAYYRSACQARDPGACQALGLMFLSGDTGEPAPLAAAELFGTACSLGAAESCRNLARLYSEGRGVARDFRAAALSYARGCELGDRASCDEAPRAQDLQGHAQGCAVGLPRDCEAVATSLGWRDKAEADAWYARAQPLYDSECDAGNFESCFDDGRLIEQGRTTLEPTASVRLYEKACGGGFRPGCCALGRLYAEGDLVPRDAAAAARFREQGAPCAEPIIPDEGFATSSSEGMAGAEEPGEPEGHALVTVYYATDRTWDPERGLPDGTRGSYGRGRSESLTFGRCTVSIPPTHQLGVMESPLSVLGFEMSYNPDKHITLLGPILQRTMPEFLAELKERVGQSRGRDLFVFIHGFNTTFEDAARRTAQMAFDWKKAGGFDGAPMFYSWPSQGGGTPLDYTRDENTATSDPTIRHLEEVLATIAQRSGATNVHLVAHSMGNRVLLHALQALAHRDGVDAPHFRQVISAAPDVDTPDYRGIVQEISKSARRLYSKLTLYASSLDRALLASKIVNGGTRAGLAGKDLLILPGVDTVDATAIDTSLWGHSYYGDTRAILSDMFSLIAEGLSPASRGLVAKMKDGQPYWACTP